MNVNKKAGKKIDANSGGVMMIMMVMTMEENRNTGTIEFFDALLSLAIF